MRSGAYRQVFLLGNYAIKLPRFKNFQKAMRCNRWENEMWHIWRPIFGWDNLCPVHYSDPYGIILVMTRAAQPVSFEEIVNADIDYYPDINVEYKPENWGRIGEKIVCLDYGIDDAGDLEDLRTYYEEKKR